MLNRVFCCAMVLAVALCGASSARATWSIVMIDRVSNEVAIGSATCLTDFDLKKRLPVVLVDVGAAAAQAMIDTTGNNRQRIWDEMLAGTPTPQILALLEAHDHRHQLRQYGIVDTRGWSVTFSGSRNGEYANGLTGQVGTLFYSIQGNVITGQPVLYAAEAALLTTPGGVPEKLMAAMEAAREMGGDGRCSCDPGDPTGCGSPPPEFEKSAHVGFMIVARRGDVDGVCNRTDGCANGDYYLCLNVKGQGVDDPDPVIQLRGLFDTWRAGLAGVPDAVESRLTLTPGRLPNDGVSTATLRIDVLDWQGLPATGISDVSVEHDPAGSAGSSAIGALNDLGGGVYEVELTAGTVAGRDRIAVRVVDAIGERFLIPSALLKIQDQRADLNGDGLVDFTDLTILLAAYAATPAGDIDGDDDTDLSDLAALLAAY